MLNVVNFNMLMWCVVFSVRCIALANSCTKFKWRRYLQTINRLLINPWSTMQVRPSVRFPKHFLYLWPASLTYSCTYLLSASFTPSVADESGRYFELEFSGNFSRYSVFLSAFLVLQLVQCSFQTFCIINHTGILLHVNVPGCWKISKILKF